MLSTAQAYDVFERFRHSLNMSRNPPETETLSLESVRRPSPDRRTYAEAVRRVQATANRPRLYSDSFVVPAARVRDRLHEEPGADTSCFPALRSARISIERFVLSPRG